MPNELVTDYCKQLGLSQILTDRVTSIADQYAKISPEKIHGIFISEYIKEDGERVLENVWFFTESLALEAKQFIAKDNYDFAVYKSVKYIRFEKTEYDFSKATTLSRMNIRVTFENDITGELKASRENCDALRDNALKLWMPRLLSDSS